MSRPLAGSRLRLRAVAFVEAPADHAAIAEDVFADVARCGGEPIQRVQRLVIVAFDSALRALEFACQLPAPLRAGFSAGDVLYEGDAIHGLPVVLASRLREHAAFGEVLCAAPVIALAGDPTGAFRELGARRLAGFSEDVTVFERVTRTAGAAPLRLSRGRRGARSAR